MNYTVTILGAGRIGAALGSLLSQNGHTIHLWDLDTSLVPHQKPLAEIIPQSRCVLLCIPSWTTRNACKEFVQFLHPDAIVISLAKGIEKESNNTVDEILQSEIPSKLIGLLHGPMLAEEFNDNLRGYGVVAAAEARVHAVASELFQDSPLILEHSYDLRGTALAGVLKNIYALALGIADGLELGGNTKGWLSVHALDEMFKIVELLGGKHGSVEGVAGLGDLIASGFSPYSRNRATGQKIIASGETIIGSEGAASLEPLLNLLGDSVAQFPLLQFLQRIIVENADANQTIADYITTYKQHKK